jgi:hypothetical protein
MKIPSKQLLVKIINKDDAELYLEHLWEVSRYGLLYYTGENGSGEYVNVHELASLCKTWAFNNGWILESCRASNHTGPDGEFESERYRVTCTSLTNKRGKSFESTTSEPDAIVKASEWILNAQTNT